MQCQRSASNDQYLELVYVAAELLVLHEHTIASGVEGTYFGAGLLGTSNVVPSKEGSYSV